MAVLFRTYFLYFVSLYLTWDVALGTEPGTLLEPGSCSEKCEIQTMESNVTVEALSKYPCSCSRSCSLYNDCCYDSPFRISDNSMKHSHTMCLSVLGKGRFRAVSKCPKHWSGPSHFCTDSIGFLPPVTSTATGTTYANIYCAVCHGDEENLKIWTVDLRCCPEHEDLNDWQFVYRRGHLRSKIGNGRKCICRYQLRDDSSFLDKLELRTCEQREEISKCSSSWDSPEDEELCKSFLDPVYVGDKVYRNQYCALCNYQALKKVQCLPSVLVQMISKGASDSEVFEHCQKHQFSVCTHYSKSYDKGKSYGFHKVMDIRMSSCIPEPGKRCCQGQKYDYRAKRCRKLVRAETWELLHTGNPTLRVE